MQSPSRAATAIASPAFQIQTSNLEIAPVYFPLDENTGNYTIQWGFVGDLERRAYVTDYPNRPGRTMSFELDMGRESGFPDDAVSVTTHVVQPWCYPIGCPNITREIMKTPEPQGDGWVKKRPCRIHLWDPQQNHSPELHRETVSEH